jgi:hypothetical protein
MVAVTLAVVANSEAPSEPVTVALTTNVYVPAVVPACCSPPPEPEAPHPAKTNGAATRTKAIVDRKPTTRKRVMCVPVKRSATRKKIVVVLARIA